MNHPLCTDNFSPLNRLSNLVQAIQPGTRHLVHLLQPAQSRQLASSVPLLTRQVKEDIPRTKIANTGFPRSA